MFTFPRLLSWLLMPLMLVCSFGLMADQTEGAAQALHLLSYIGADYPATVVDGKVIDASEYREQIEFLGALQALIVALPARDGQKELEQGVASLYQAIEAKQDGASVARQARQLATRLAAAYEVSQAPLITPD